MTERIVMEQWWDIEIVSFTTDLVEPQLVQSDDDRVQRHQAGGRVPPPWLLRHGIQYSVINQ